MPKFQESFEALKVRTGDAEFWTLASEFLMDIQYKFRYDYPEQYRYVQKESNTRQLSKNSSKTPKLLNTTSEKNFLN